MVAGADADAAVQGDAGVLHHLERAAGRVHEAVVAVVLRPVEAPSTRLLPANHRLP